MYVLTAKQKMFGGMFDGLLGRSAPAPAAPPPSSAYTPEYNAWVPIENAAATFDDGPSAVDDREDTPLDFGIHDSKEQRPPSRRGWSSRDDDDNNFVGARAPAPDPASIIRDRRSAEVNRRTPAAAAAPPSSQTTRKIFTVQEEEEKPTVPPSSSFDPFTNLEPATRHIGVDYDRTTTGPVSSLYVRFSAERDKKLERSDAKRQRTTAPISETKRSDEELYDADDDDDDVTPKLSAPAKRMAAFRRHDIVPPGERTFGPSSDAFKIVAFCTTLARGSFTPVNIVLWDEELKTPDKVNEAIGPIYDMGSSEAHLFLNENGMVQRHGDLEYALHYVLTTGVNGVGTAAPAMKEQLITSMTLGFTILQSRVKQCPNDGWLLQRTLCELILHNNPNVRTQFARHCANEAAARPSAYGKAWVNPSGQKAASAERKEIVSFFCYVNTPVGIPF